MERRLGAGASRRLLGNGWKKRDAALHAEKEKMMAKRIPKYGIPFHTIKYWQDQARNLYRYNGIYAGRGEIERSAETLGARGLGHAIIGLAAVASPEHLLAVLNGTRGRRWS